MSNRPQRWCSRFFLVSILIYASPEIPAQSIPVGAAYVGSGYDVLFGNPDGATFTSGGIDPGLKPAKFVLQKTFKERSGYCPGEATCVEVGGTLSEETFSLHADLQQYKDDITALWTTDTDAGILIANFGGTLSFSFKEAKTIINRQEKVILTARRVSIAGDVVYNLRQNRRLNVEFLDALCELPTNYTQSVYISFIKEWGTHVVTGAKLGMRESIRREFSKKTVMNELQRNQSYAVSNKGGILAFVSSSLSGSVSSQVIQDLRSNSETVRSWTSSVGSPAAPAPISLTLRGIEKFLTAAYILNDTRNQQCTNFRSGDDISALRVNIQQALADYPAVLGAESPTSIVRSIKLTWPRGSYSLLMAKDGCPDGTWANGSRYHDTVDRSPKNKWSDHFEDLTASSLWRSNIELRFCSKIVEFDENSLDWPAGAYCLFKKGDCPNGFDTGSYYVDDEFFFNRDSFTGVLPDGEYSSKTKYQFCCRDDGSVNKPIFVPTERPFLLMPLGPACQNVDGMNSTLHWLRIHTMWNGWSMMIGKHPYATEHKTKWTWYFCHYQSG